MASHNIEHIIANSSNADSFISDQVIPLGDWRTTTNAVPTETAAATPFWAAISTKRFLRWRQDAAAANLLRLVTNVPGEYDPDRDMLQVLLSLRKWDSASADENTDLQMVVSLIAHQTGEVNPNLAETDVPSAADMIDGGTTLITAGRARTLPAASSAFMFRWFAFNFSLGTTGRVTPAQRLRPGDSIQIIVNPHETVGTTDMTVDMDGSILRWRRQATVRSPKVRESLRIFSEV